jgi:altronate hydrolase
VIHPEGPPAVLVLDPSVDNVAVALRTLGSGERIEAADRNLDLRAQIPAGHKLALAPIAAGAEVLKYGEPIGVAVIAIEQGDHVHVHNVASARLPGSTS